MNSQPGCGWAAGLPGLKTVLDRPNAGEVAPRFCSSNPVWFNQLFNGRDVTLSKIDPCESELSIYTQPSYSDDNNAKKLYK